MDAVQRFMSPLLPGFGMVYHAYFTLLWLSTSLAVSACDFEPLLRLACGVGGWEWGWVRARKKNSSCDTLDMEMQSS
jgi:hypothetical protein